MTNKVYRTSRGKQIDMGALQLKNELVKSIGNMGVNARGDLVDAQNKPIDSRNKSISRQYKKQTNVPAPTAKPIKPMAEKVNVPPPPEDFDDNFEKPTPTESQENLTGIAAAVAKARQAKPN
jgi:hypothetical protein